jgi:hypothetical protein
MAFNLALLGASSAGLSRYYFATLGNGAYDFIGDGTYDSSGNLYLTGNSGYLGKYTIGLERIWETRVSSFNSGDVGIDSAQNVYVSGTSAVDLGRQNDGGAVKFDSSGVLQWARALGAGGYDSFGAIAMDSSGNSYHGGSVQGQFGQNKQAVFLAKYNSSGSLQWQRILGQSTNNQFGPYQIAIDSGDNIYVGGMKTNDPSGPFGLVAKYNSSGSLQWQRFLTGAPTRIQAQYLSVDSSDNLYVSGGAGTQAADPNFRVPYLAKFTSGGSLQWQRTPADGPLSNEGKKLSFDNANNVYLATSTGAVKFSSAGVVQWERSWLGVDINKLLILPDPLSGEEDLIWLGTTSKSGQGSNDSFVARTPIDGSLTGSYQLGGATYTYQASSIGAFSDPGYSSGGGSLSSASTSFSSDTLSNTQSLVESVKDLIII